MRRLPIFFVLDVSESMVGENLRQMSQGMEALVKTLRTDPHALESVYLSTIVFAGKALVLTPLVELASFYPPRLPVGSGTSIGAALTAVMNQIDLCVVKGNAEVKGDWKPIVYLFTDGKPTDDAAAAIAAALEYFLCPVGGWTIDLSLALSVVQRTAALTFSLVGGVLFLTHRKRNMEALHQADAAAKDSDAEAGSGSAS